TAKLGSGTRSLAVGQFALNAENLRNPLGADGRSVKEKGEGSHGSYWPVKARHIGEKDDHVAGGELSAEGVRGPVPHDDGYATSGDDIHEGPDPGLVAHTLEIGFQVFFAPGPEALFNLVLLCETLHNPDGRKSFLRQGGH